MQIAVLVVLISAISKATHLSTTTVFAALATAAQSGSRAIQQHSAHRIISKCGKINDSSGGNDTNGANSTDCADGAICRQTMQCCHCAADEAHGFMMLMVLTSLRLWCQVTNASDAG